MDTPTCWWLRLRLYLNMSRLGFIQKCCFAALSFFALFNNQQTLWMQNLHICAKSRAITFFAAKSQGFEFWNSAVGAVLGCRDMTEPVSSGFGTPLSASLENHWWSCVELPVLSSHRCGGHSNCTVLHLILSSASCSVTPSNFTSFFAPSMTLLSALPPGLLPASSSLSILLPIYSLARHMSQTISFSGFLSKTLHIIDPVM